MASRSLFKVKDLLEKELPENSPLCELSMTSSSLVTNPENCEVNFDRMPSLERPFVPISETEMTPYAEIATEGYLVLSTEDEVPQKCKDGSTKLKLEDNFLCRASVNITLWEGLVQFIKEKHNEGSRWFRFANVSTRVFLNEKVLSTTEETVCTVSENDEEALHSADHCRSVTDDNDRYEERRAEKLALVEYNGYHNWF